MTSATRWLGMLVLLGLQALPGAAWAQSARLALPDFSALDSKASETVNITLDAALLGMAAKFLDPKVPEEANARAVVAGLQGIFVRSYRFDDAFAYPKADIDKLRLQLQAPLWSRLVEVRSRKESTEVEISLQVDGNRAKGLAIIASEPREFTVVNIVGDVDLDKLHALEGQFGVPKLDLEKAGKKPAK